MQQCELGCATFTLVVSAATLISSHAKMLSASMPTDV